MIVIQVMGPGCARHQEAVRLVTAVVDEGRIEAMVETITDFSRMAAQRVFATPAVLVNGAIKSVGRTPQADEVRDWLTSG